MGYQIKTLLTKTDSFATKDYTLNVNDFAIKSTQKENISSYMAFQRRMPGLQRSV